MKRRHPIETCPIHHVYSKSIQRFKIFTCEEEYQRMSKLISYYQFSGQPLKFSHYIDREIIKKEGFTATYLKDHSSWKKLVNIHAYCVMPTHVHFILEEKNDQGIETFVRRCFNAYTRYFNLRHNRRGPLWEHRFGNTPIENDEHLAKALDYVLTNPVKDGLVLNPSDWKYSSFNHLHTGSGGG